VAHFLRGRAVLVRDEHFPGRSRGSRSQFGHADSGYACLSSNHSGPACSLALWCSHSLSCFGPRSEARSCPTTSPGTRKAAGVNEGGLLAGRSQVPPRRPLSATHTCCSALLCCAGAATEVRDRGPRQAFRLLFARYSEAVTAECVRCAGIKARTVLSITLEANDA
jgi:hypothetical protein